MSGKSRWRGYPRAHQPHGGEPLRPGIDYDNGRDGSPYSFEGSMARNWNVIGSLTSRDPRFRRKAARVMAVFWAVTVLPGAVVAIALLVRAL